MFKIKTFIYALALSITSNVFCQELSILTTIEGEAFDFGPETVEIWKKRDQLFEDLESNKKDWNNLSKEDNALFEKYPETYSSMWDVEGGGCSWYCGAGAYEVTTSSELASNGKLGYETKNLTDFSYQTAWVEGKKGYGIGESIEFSFAPAHPRVTTIIFANGYVKSKKAWKNNSRVHKLKMYLNDKPYAMIELKDVYAKQSVKLDKPLGYDRVRYDTFEGKENWNLKFEIVSVYKGDKYDDTAITELFFDGLDVHCLAKGTLITMGDKSLKKIESLSVGDEILSYNQKNEATEIAVITELASPMHKDLIKVNFSDQTSITCTKDHPFLSANGQWASNDPKKTEKDYLISNVQELRLGTALKTINGTIEVVNISLLQQEQQTYTIVNTTKNKSFIANGIITGIEQLRIPMKIQNLSK